MYGLVKNSLVKICCPIITPNVCTCVLIHTRALTRAYSNLHIYYVTLELYTMSSLVLY